MQLPTISLLYIDDEENNLNAFKASFRRHYEIYTAISADAGLKILEHVNIHVIIADQKMPNTTGVEFFTNIIKTYPDATRMLLTGYVDPTALADAINHGDIYRYLTKPWNDFELQNSIKNAYDAHIAKIELRQKMIELEKTNNELNRFIYSISHELRAPLVSLNGIINLVRLENLDQSSGEYWQLAENCAQKLDYYIQKTLEYYKNSKALAEINEIDFSKMIEDLIKIYQLSNPDTQFDISIDQEVTFKNDMFRIEVILANLISNAIKYQKNEVQNKKVGINVKVKKEETEINIVDNGIGILNEHLDKIFNQFFKVNTHQGTGLGLFIVKEALEKINGKISVFSNINQGTTFKIIIPNANL